MLIAFDSVSDQVIECLKNGLQSRLRAEVSVLHQDFVPMLFFDFGRNQFNSTAIVEWLENELRECITWQRATKVLAVTTRDLYIPMLTFVFGGARLNGLCAMVSSHRLGACRNNDF